MSASSSAASNAIQKKKPLSAYNLYYRYKRSKIIEASAACPSTKESICALVSCPPGLESFPPAVRAMIPPSQANDVRRMGVRTTLEGQLFSKDRTNRLHRKSAHGYKMSFVEMNKVMVEGWKKTDAFAKAVFKELADEAKKEYQRRLKDLNDERNLCVLGIKRTSPSVAQAEAPVSNNVSNKHARLSYTAYAAGWPSPTRSSMAVTTSASNALASSCPPLSLGQQQQVFAAQAPFQATQAVHPLLRSPAAVTPRTNVPVAALPTTSVNPSMMLPGLQAPPFGPTESRSHPFAIAPLGRVQHGESWGEFNMVNDPSSSNDGCSMHLPEFVETKGEMEPSNNDNNGPRPAMHKHNVSVEDFMQLIAAIDEEL